MLKSVMVNGSLTSQCHLQQLNQVDARRIARVPGVRKMWVQDTRVMQPRIPFGR
jgi:hypothetical protein